MRRGAASRITSTDEGLNAPGELAAGEQDATTARVALQANIGSQSHHVPVVAAARMWFAQPHHVAKSNFYRHVHTMGPNQGPDSHSLGAIVAQPRARCNFVFVGSAGSNLAHHACNRRLNTVCRAHAVCYNAQTLWQTT